jgi:electron transfer flavoprotein alpha subunit
MADYKDVLVFGEMSNGHLSLITTELLGGGRSLADQLGEALACILAGDTAGKAATDAIAFGADKVYTVESPRLKEYHCDSYMQVAEQLIKELSPRIILMGQTAMGRELGPRLAFKLNTGLTTDAIDLNIDSESKLLQQTKPVYGGNAQAVFTCELMPQMATVRPKALSALERDDARAGEVITKTVSIDESALRWKIVDRVKEEVAGLKLEDAPVIVSGGRGIGGPEPFGTVLKELADVLHGAVGASRPPADNGWVPESMHIGLTGKIVAPDLYVAVAISGASQHIAGCSGAKTIIAVNKDPEANIFREASYGVVGRYEEVLPALTRKLKELLAD